MSSRLALDAHGRPIVVVTGYESGIPGTVYRVLGNDLPCGEPGVQWLGARTGRRNPVTAPRRTNRDPVPVDA